MELIKNSQWYPSKNLYNRGIQNSRYQNKSLNSYLQHKSQQNHRSYTYPNNVTHNHLCNNSNNHHNQASSYYYRPYQRNCYIERLEREV